LCRCTGYRSIFAAVEKALAGAAADKADRHAADAAGGGAAEGKERP